VSLNVEDWRASPLHEVVAAVQREAATRGLRVTGSELVGLLPAGAAVAAAGSLLGVAGLDPSHVLELRLLTDGSVASVVPRSRDQDATDA
jgi:glutamate formiminotransferase